MLSMLNFIETWRRSPVKVVAGAALAITAFFAALLLLLLHLLAVSQRSTVPKTRRKHTPTHLLVVLGSGGHTAEMLSMLRRLPLDPTVYTFRTYVVTSGDSFSAAKAADFEASLREKYKESRRSDGTARDPASGPSESVSYSIVTVPRARRVHQSFWTAPLSTIQCFWACIKVLRGIHPDQRVRPQGTASPYPDLILTNGPATAVCVVLAAKLLRLLNAVSAPFTGQDHHRTDSSVGGRNLFPLRTIFIESWARVTSFSLSGKILLPFVDRFLVQWPNLEGRRAWRGMRETEYVGALVE
ncbi:hypothetical protein VTN77DRAFT_1237 [Rasamsonia byssochlamydoides]|uniref:uncharacterized protein n=1 Tax=Rasamsonia byssochlamydoides TaxID=89139 RepID=UPI0037446369